MKNNNDLKQIATIHIVQMQTVNDAIICKVYLNNKFFCFGLQNKNYPIPYGVYPAIRSTLHLPIIRLLLLNVKGHTGVEIHEGNKAKDVHGCTCVGMTTSEDEVHGSVKALEQIINFVSEYSQILVYWTYAGSQDTRSLEETPIL